MCVGRLNRLDSWNFAWDSVHLHLLVLLLLLQSRRLEAQCGAALQSQLMLHGVHFIVVQSHAHATIRYRVPHRGRLLGTRQQTHQQNWLIERSSPCSSCCSYRVAAPRQLFIANAVATVALTASSDLLLLVPSQRWTQWILTRHIHEQTTWIDAAAAAIGIVDAAADDDVATVGIVAPRCVLYGLGTVAQTDVANWIIYTGYIYIYIGLDDGERQERERKNQKWNMFIGYNCG